MYLAIGSMLLSGMSVFVARGAPAPTASLRLGSTTAINITRNGQQSAMRGAPERFTGAVRIDPLFQPQHPSKVYGAHVTFDIAIQESLEDTNVYWLEPVSDQQYMTPTR